MHYCALGRAIYQYLSFIFVEIEKKFCVTNHKQAWILFGALQRKTCKNLYFCHLLPFMYPHRCDRRMCGFLKKQKSPLTCPGYLCNCAGVTDGKMKLSCCTLETRKNKKRFVDFKLKRSSSSSSSSRSNHGYLQNYVSPFYNHGRRSAISQSRIEFGIIINPLKVKAVKEKRTKKEKTNFTQRAETKTLLLPLGRQPSGYKVMHTIMANSEFHERSTIEIQLKVFPY